MKRILLLVALTSSCFAMAQTKEELKSIQKQRGFSDTEMHKIFVTKDFVKDMGEELYVLDSICIKKGDYIHVYLPTSGTDFLYVKPKQGLFSTANLIAAADVITTSAEAVGKGTNDSETLTKAMDIRKKSDAISQGADSLEKLESLPISNNSKKIAGKRMQVVDWEFNGIHVVSVKLGKKRYLIELENAYITGEIKL